jgi:hypothetical protein
MVGKGPGYAAAPSVAVGNIVDAVIDTEAVGEGDCVRSVLVGGVIAALCDPEQPVQKRMIDISTIRCNLTT